MKLPVSEEEDAEVVAAGASDVEVVAAAFEVVVGASVVLGVGASVLLVFAGASELLVFTAALVLLVSAGALEDVVVDGAADDDAKVGTSPPTLTGAADVDAAAEDEEALTLVDATTELELWAALELALALELTTALELATALELELARAELAVALHRLLIERLRATTDGATGSAVAGAATLRATTAWWWRSRAMWGVAMAYAERAQESRRRDFVKYMATAGSKEGESATLSASRDEEEREWAGYKEG